MKGAFEYGVIMMLSLPIVVIFLSFANVLVQYQNARYLQEYMISLIEHHNRYDEQIASLIQEANIPCKDCKVEVKPIHQRYEIEVRFPIEIAVLQFRNEGIVFGATVPISEKKLPSE